MRDDKCLLFKLLGCGGKFYAEIDNYYNPKFFHFQNRSLFYTFKVSKANVSSKQLALSLPSADLVMRQTLYMDPPHHVPSRFTVPICVREMHERLQLGNCLWARPGSVACNFLSEVINKK